MCCLYYRYHQIKELTEKDFCDRLIERDQQNIPSLQENN